MVRANQGERRVGRLKDGWVYLSYSPARTRRSNNRAPKMRCLALLAFLLTLTSCQNPSRPLPLDSLVDRSFIEDGGLTSYGANLIGLYRRVASYVDRIFKGEKPTDLTGHAINKVRAGRQSRLDQAQAGQEIAHRLRADGLSQWDASWIRIRPAGSR